MRLSIFFVLGFVLFSANVQAQDLCDELLSPINLEKAVSDYNEVYPLIRKAYAENATVQKSFKEARKKLPQTDPRLKSFVLSARKTVVEIQRLKNLLENNPTRPMEQIASVIEAFHLGKTITVQNFSGELLEGVLQGINRDNPSGVLSFVLRPHGDPQQEFSVSIYEVIQNNIGALTRPHVTHLPIPTT